MHAYPTRRRFMIEATGTAAFLPAACATLAQLAATLVHAEESPAAYWLAVREQFAFTEHKVSLNAANLCPSPRTVAERVAELTRDIDADCSFNNRGKFGAMLETSREKVARQLGVSPDEIALVRNTSEANNIINNGLPLRAGDEVVVWNENHPTNNVAWDVRAKRFGLSVKRLKTPPRPTSVEQLIEVFTGAITDQTRVLALTHVSNTSGLRLPVRELCEAAHRHDIHVHVDGAQTWGALDVNLRELGCDSYSASSHKWFAGPKEVGLLFVKQVRIAEIWPGVVASGWGNGTETQVRGARKFESLGQRDDAALAAIGDTADFHGLIGAPRIEQRIAALASALKNSLADAGFSLVTPVDPRLSAGVCVLDVPAIRRSDVAQRLYDEFGIAAATTGGLRLCPHIYNTMSHIERTVEAVKAMRSWIL
jgi:isopenicillin-N epimerase